MAPLETLVAELDRWPADSIGLWLRDDDAVDVSPPLERLLDLRAAFRLPLLLAVIPGTVQATLAKRLARETAVYPCQHGWLHRNHAPQGQKSAEFGAHRPLEALLADLHVGRDRLAGVFGDRVAAVFVPPWNRIAPDLIPLLPAAGFRMLSAFRPVMAEVPDLPLLHPDIDVIDWRGGRLPRSPDDIAREAAATLSTRRLRGERTTILGLLLHHLVQEPEAWLMLEGLLRPMMEHPALRPADPPPWR
jgi:hypothetical protein